METIIGLLFILLPVIFKLIGKNLEKAGNTEAGRKIEEFLETFSDADENNSPNQHPFRQEQSGQMPETESYFKPEVRTEPVPFKKPVVMKETVKADKDKSPKTPVAVEEKKKADPIDPKKLVIYSEIMKPKF